MKKYILLPLVALIFSIATPSCQKINEEPPRNDGALSRKYAIPKPTPLTAEQAIILKQIRDEYNAAVK